MLALLAPAKTAKESLYSDTPLQIPDWQHGETVPLTVGKVTKLGQQIDARLFEPQDITGWVFRAALGKGFLPPEAGEFTITYGANTTAGIGFAPTAQQIEDALNLLASIIAAGGVTVTGDSGFFFITFDEEGARTDFTGDAENLYPLSTLDFGQAIPGSAELREVWILQVMQNPGAYSVLAIASDPPAAGVALVQTGGAGLNAKVRVSLTARQSGSLIVGAQYTITAFIAGDNFTNVGAASNATGVTFIATGTTPTTWANKSALSRVDATQPYDGSWSIAIRGLESAMIARDALAADVVSAIENIYISSGLLVTGAKYVIAEFVTGDDFTNLGGTNETGNVFVASGTTPTDWTNSSILRPVGTGNVSVTREAEGQWLIAFQGDMANTVMGTISADGSSLRVLQSFSGTLDLRTAALAIIIGEDSSASVIFEVEGTPPGGTPQKLFRADGTLVASIIRPSNTTPPIAEDGYYYFGDFLRLVPGAGGGTWQASIDGTTWQTVATMTAS